MVKWLGDAGVVPKAMAQEREDRSDWSDWECPEVSNSELLNQPWIVPCHYDGYWSKKYCRICNKEGSVQHIRETKHLYVHFVLDGRQFGPSRYLFP